jgi:rhodanese-related sulfurtransferase
MKSTFIYVSSFILFLSCASAVTNEPENPIEETTTNQTTIAEPVATVEKTVISKDLTAQEFKKGIDGGNILLLDVRTPGEFAGGSIAGAINIDYTAADFSQQIDGLSKDKPVYLFCQSGGRSGKALKVFTDKGFPEVYNLIGGYGAWPFK